jgi:hypothetical protein
LTPSGRAWHERRVGVFVGNEIRFEAPETWIDASVLSLVSPEEGPLRANVLVTRDALGEGEDLAGYVEEQIAELRKKLKAWTLIRREMTEDGMVIEYTFKSQENRVIRQRQLYRGRGDTVYAVSMTHAEERFESVRSTFERIVATFTVD